MEIVSSFSSFLSSQPFYVAVPFTVLCLLFALFFARSLLLSSKPKLAEPEGCAGSLAEESEDKGKEKRCFSSCHCNGSVGIASSNSEPNTTTHLNVGGSMDMVSRSSIVIDRHTGASMMEQLVPEITTHALSYLDFPSLCRLSMTNSLMRKAANDGNAWKALYHKDFTLEQDSITPINGWKAYYAATRAILNTNTEFFSIISERSLSAMSHFWLNADYVKCFHASGEYSTGFRSVIQSWQRIFNWEQGVNFHVRDVRARILTDFAWVTMKAYVDVDTGPFNTTNLFEFLDGRWYMVGHHCSVMETEVEQPNVHG